MLNYGLFKSFVLRPRLFIFLISEKTTQNMLQIVTYFDVNSKTLIFLYSLSFFICIKYQQFSFFFHKSYKLFIEVQIFSHKFFSFIQKLLNQIQVK